jgi:hypothetical protein
MFNEKDAGLENGVDGWCGLFDNVQTLGKEFNRSNICFVLTDNVLLYS